MKKRRFDLQLFTDVGGSGAGVGAGAGGGGGDGGRGGAGGAPGGQSGAAGTPQGGAYSYEQTEQIADARADRAEKAALSNYFRSQGVSEEEIKTAISECKAKRAAQQPDATAMERERDAALAKVAELENSNYLRDKGVRPDDLDYVLFKAGQRVDDKADFKKAADAFLKENPRFMGQGYKVVSTGKPDGGSGTGQTVNDSINASIRSAFGR